MSGLMEVIPQDIWEAYKRIRNHIRHTPLDYSIRLSQHTGAEVYLKMESLQVTGSFKPRGGFNRLLTLTETESQKGIAAPTGGNHGIGISYAAHQLGIPANIYLPKDTDKAKINLLEAYGANIQYFESMELARQAALQAQLHKGQVFVSAYNDPAMIAGGATAGIEILEDLPNVEIVILGIGGGGLASGIGIIMKSINPDIQIWVVQTKNSPTFGSWLEAGEPIPVKLKPSIAVGISGYVEPETITFPIIQKVADKVITVTDPQLIDAMHWLLEYEQHVAEPTGIAAVAALQKNGDQCKGKKIAALVTGRNISISHFFQWEK